MKKSEMADYVREELWIDRVRETMSHWEHLQGLEVPEDIKDSIVEFLRKKIRRGIEKGTLLRTFMQIAVTSLIYIKMRNIK